MFFKEFVFAFTIPFTFPEIMKAILLVEHLLTADFLTSHKHKLTGNAKLFTSLGSSRFKMSGPSFFLFSHF